MIIIGISLLLAFATGFAIKRGNICAVVAVNRWVAHRDALHLRAFGTGICCAGLVLLTLTWCLPNVARLSPEAPLTVMTIIGGVLFGVGAWVNKACVLGTVAFLCRGDFSYVGSLVGMCAGAIIGQFGYRPIMHPNASPIQTTTFLAIGIACFYALVPMLDAWGRYRAQRDMATEQPPGSYRMLQMIAVVGVCCSMLHVLNGEWTYLAGFTRIAEYAANKSPNIPLGLSLLYAIVTFAGGIFSAKCSGEFQALPFALGVFLKRLLGGTTMGVAACMIPGGNESMMFYSVPSLSLHAIVAYASMTLTLAVLSLQQHRTVRQK